MTNITAAPTTRADYGGGQAAFYSNSNVVPLPLIEKAAGVHMWDDRGNRYVDVSSGPAVSNIGHGNTRVADAMTYQARQLEYAWAQVVQNRPNLDLSARLARLAGPGFERVSLTSGGSEAMENAIKLLRQYAIATKEPSRTKIISCLPSYHGATVSTLAISGDTRLEAFLNGFAEPSPKVPAPLSYRVPPEFDVSSYADFCADALEAKIVELGAENVLAFIIEPVGGLSTGCLVPPDKYFYRIRDICTRHGVRLVFDEILCGMGRTGKFLTAHHWPDALPDIITMAKGLASGYSPLGAVLAPADIVDQLAELSGFEFQYSYNANPVSCAAGLAVLDEYDRLDLVNQAAVMGQALREGLEQLKSEFQIIGDIRGLGMLLAVELVSDRQTKAPMPIESAVTEKVRSHGLNNGLMIYARTTCHGMYGQWFLVSPPLTITQEEVGDLLERLAATLNDLANDR